MNRRIITIFAVTAGLTCTEFDPLSPDGSLLPGTWGGGRAALIVGDTSAHVHIACTFGDIPDRIVPTNGHFDLEGTYVLRAYPVAMGPELPAHFSGTLRGAEVTLTVVVDDTTTGETVTLGPVVVRFGQDPQMLPCPLCTMKK